MNEITVNRIYCRLMVLIAIILLPQISYSGEIQHEFTFNENSLRIDSVNIDNNNIYNVLTWEDMGSWSVSAEPSIPVYTANFVVPTFSNNFKVRVIEAVEGRTINLNNPILPAQPDKSLSMEISEEFTGAIGKEYSLSNDRPDARYTGHMFVDGDTHIATIAIRPCAYDAIGSKLHIFNKIRVCLSYDECTKEEAGLLPNADITNKRNLNISTLVVNPDDYVASKSAISRQNFIDNYNIGEYCIITPKKLIKAFDRLILWKKQKGYDVTVKSIESIIDDPNYCPTGKPEREDSAASVRAFIKSLYDQSLDGHVFCLLAGHYEDGMPIRWIRSASASKSFDSNNKYYYNKLGVCYIPTDTYFCDVLTSWNLIKEDKSGIFTAVDKDNSSLKI